MKVGSKIWSQKRGRRGEKTSQKGQVLKKGELWIHPYIINYLLCIISFKFVYPPNVVGDVVMEATIFDFHVVCFFLLNTEEPICF